MKQELADFILPMGALLVVAIIIPITASFLTDKRMWNTTVEYADLLQYACSYCHLYRFEMRDTEGELLYSVLLDDKDKDCCVFSNDRIEVIASPFNGIMSRRMYNVLKKKLLKEGIITYSIHDKKKYIINKLKQL